MCSMNFNQGQGFDPMGEISLSYIDRLMMDCFSPTFPSFLSKHNKVLKCEKIDFLLIGFTLIPRLRVRASLVSLRCDP